jgi:hypothetical protein
MVHALSRGEILIAMAAATGSTPATSFAWLPIPAGEAGVAADLGDRIDAAQRNGELPGLHGFLLARRGRLALERYYPGTDQTWGRSLGLVAFGPDTLHDLRSVTKSLVGLLYGIALAEGKVPAPNAVLVDQFPEYSDLAADPVRRRLTIAHVLTMTMGLEWNENLPYTSPANSEIAMERAPDRYRFVLERPIREAPGARWSYSGGATALLGRLIACGVGAPLPTMRRPRCSPRSAYAASSGSGARTVRPRRRRAYGSCPATCCASASSSFRVGSGTAGRSCHLPGLRPRSVRRSRSMAQCAMASTGIWAKRSSRPGLGAARNPGSAPSGTAVRGSSSCQDSSLS